MPLSERVRNRNEEDHKQRSEKRDSAAEQQDLTEHIGFHQQFRFHQIRFAHGRLHVARQLVTLLGWR